MWLAPLLPQMTGDYNFPEAANGLRLLRPVSEAASCDFLGRTAGEEIIPLHITLDWDWETVGSVFNRNCPGLDGKPVNAMVYTAGFDTELLDDAVEKSIRLAQEQQALEEAQYNLWEQKWW